METRKKIDFEFIKKNFSIIEENFLITEVNGKKYIGRLFSVGDDWFKLANVRSFEETFKGSYTHLTFYIISTDIFLPTLADIGKFGKEILFDYSHIIVQSHAVFLEEINQILDEQEKK